MKNYKFALISLGCEKNLVDSEWILGLLPKSFCEIVTDYASADCIIINTCGFITSAKEEAINTIYEYLGYKENGCKIIATGCLVQRYLKELEEGIPEVDLYIPIREYKHFGDKLATLFNDNRFNGLCPSYKNRLVSTPSYLAYVRISDGCNNRCTYCAIPLIRGSFKSRNYEEIIDEVKYLVKSGRKEICLISQDLTRYGSDMENMSLSKLVSDLCQIEGDFFIRMLYLYPDEITKELIEVVKNNSKVMPYFDIPIQHASNKLLKWMNRRGTKEEIRDIINYIRSEIKDAIIRTTIIVGFPHETDKDFNELIDFISEMKFDHLGAFTYSKEEDTLSYNMTHHVSQKIKDYRFDKLMETQKYISLKNNSKYINNTYNCIIESFDKENNLYQGRNYMYAPDDIDGCVIIKGKDLEIGKVYKVKITDADFYDLIGEVIY